MPTPAQQGGSGILMTRSRELQGMKEMCRNMLMEAAEKCEEIEVKCEEEYRVLRSKEIAEQREIILKNDRKRRNEVAREDRVYYTKFINNARLALLKSKNDIVQQVREDVKFRLQRDPWLARDSAYTKLMTDSLTQALFMLNEPEVKVVCRKKDQERFTACFQQTATVYESNMKKRITICISKHVLPANSLGGMIVTNKSEDTTVNCQLDSRVEHIVEQAMPLIVHMLFSGITLTWKDLPKVDALSYAESCRLNDSKSTKSALIRHSEEEAPTPLDREGPLGSSIRLVQTPPSDSDSRDPSRASLNRKSTAFSSRNPSQSTASNETISRSTRTTSNRTSTSSKEQSHPPDK